jgi:RNA polymerase sigma factor (sigma-70 family)
VPHELLNQAENEQAMREVIDELSPRCQQMIRMLFFENPARPYEEIAKQLGLATGSIGFIRGRCLKRMRQALENRGFR